MRKIVNLFLGLLLVFGAAYVLIWGSWTAVSWFLTLPTDRMTPIAALTGVLLVPIIAYFTSRGLERRRSRENAIREKKTTLYDEMMRGLLRLLNLQKVDEMSEGEMLKLFADITPPLISYGSRAVIRAWNNFRQIGRTHPGDTRASLLAFENLLKAMRKDLGHTVIFHPQGELLGVFINDAKESLEGSQTK